MFKSSKAGKIIIAALLVLAAAVFLAKTYLINLYRVPESGMYPTIKPGGLVFARLHPYRHVREVRRGDVVVFKQVEENEQITQVWRVIGLPGDAIQVLGDTVMVNGEALKREEVRKENKLTIFREYNGKAVYEVAIETPVPTHAPPTRLTVPEGKLFVLGDNRFNAQDSRYLGPFKFETVIGKKL